jgi:hypothetical protein
LPSMSLLDVKDPGLGEYPYGDRALKLSSSALKAGGVFAVWAEEPGKGSLSVPEELAEETNNYYVVKEDSME